MEEYKFLTNPTIVPPLDEHYRPPILANRAFLQAVQESGASSPIVIGIERNDGSFSRFETLVFSDNHPDALYNQYYIERIIKFLLWQKGGWKVHVGGSKIIGEHIKTVYADNGERKFDWKFMGKVYNHVFEVVLCEPEEVPEENEKQRALGRNLNGNRIGFDLGASDLKVSAVMDGKVVFSTEIEWHPVEQTDPSYHIEHIRAALLLAASKLPSVDAIGGSSAGVYINNRPVVASLYRSIPTDQFEKIRNMFLEIQEEMQAPIKVVNDGEVTALAGSMSLEDNGILGIAMGSSEAAGYVTMDGNITDWLNELAFAPVDFSPIAPIDEWSGDRGVGALYFSQQGIFRLAPIVEINIPFGLTNAGKLEFIQEKLEAGEEGAKKIWETLGIYLGYTIAHYADFYEIKHVLLLGRCTSGLGGEIILEMAKEVLNLEFPYVADNINIQLPDEKSRRVGQSIAAASLPEFRKGANDAV